MPSADLRRRLLWLIGIRAAVSAALLGFGLLVQIASPGEVAVSPYFLLIGVTFGLTLVHLATLRLVDQHRWLVDVQLAGDSLVITGFIAVTGGITSYFSLLYVLPIIGVSPLRGRRGALTLAVLSGAMYGTAILTQYGQVAGIQGLPWPTGGSAALPPAGVAQYTAWTNILSFLAVGLLSGSLAESIRRTGASLERASSELADLQALSQHVIDSLTSGLVTTDRSGRVLTVNRAAEVITGHPPAAIIGRQVAEVLQLPDPFARLLAADLEGALSRRADFHYRTPDGRTIDLGLSVTHLMTPSGRAGFLVTFQDVTEARRFERDVHLRQRLAAVGEMAAGIAHEIRNPLASMSGSIQVLRNELSLSDEQAQLMDIVLRESERLNATITNFLAYARPQRFAIATVDIGQLLQDAALLLRNSAEVKPGHVIAIDVPDLPVTCEADEGQLKQIVWNLATNALRAMPDGGELALRAVSETHPGGAPEAGPNVVLSVTDHGKGIPAEELDGLFQPFKGSFERGSGLGLAIVHRIVTDYNGEIQVTSHPGEGTTVRVRLPARRP